MRDIIEMIAGLFMVLLALVFCATACWLNWPKKGKEIGVIQEPKLAPEIAELEANCRRFKESVPQTFRRDNRLIREFQERCVKEADGAGGSDSDDT